MTITSGFFNSINSDRVYDAEDLNTIFDGVITPGTFQNIGDALTVLEGTGLQVIVQPGRAWYNNTWLDNDSNHILNLSVASAGFDRIDVIAMDFNRDNAVRENDIVVVEGTADASPVAPTLINTVDRIQIPLAHVLIPASSTQVLQANITNKVGTNDNPFITSILQQVSVSTLLTQWESDFDTWFSNIQAQLTGNVVTNLQGQIDTINTTIANLPDPEVSVYGRNLMNNGDMSVMQRGAWPGDVVSLSGYKPGVPDRWKIVANMNGNFRINHVAIPGIQGKWLEVQCITTSPQGWNSGNGYLIFEQPIEGWRTAGIGYGTPDEKPVTISFKTFGNYPGTYYVQVYDATFTQYYPFTIGDEVVETHEILLDHGVYAHGHGNDTGLRVRLWYGSGNGRFGGDKAINTFMGLAGNKLGITDVQLEIGETASNFDRMSYEQNLLECQRYFEVSEQFVVAHTFNSGSTSSPVPRILIQPAPYRTPKRVDPAITLNAVNWYFADNAVGSATLPADWIGVANVNLSNSRFQMAPQEINAGLTQAQFDSFLPVSNSFASRIEFEADAEIS